MRGCIPVRAPYITIYFSSRGKPSEDEMKKTLLENIKVKHTSAEDFFNSPEIQSILVESLLTKEKFLNVMMSKYGFENPRQGEKVSKPVDDWGIVELENIDNYRYSLTYYISIDHSKVMLIADQLLNRQLVTMAGVNRSEQFKEKYPLQAGNTFVFRGIFENLSKYKILAPDFEAKMKVVIHKK